MQNIELEKSIFLQHCEDVMFFKQSDYAPNSNRFEEFDWSAIEMGTNPLEHLDNLLMKHLYSIMKIEEAHADVDSYQRYFGKSYLLEKYGDAYNYCILGSLMMGLEKYRNHTINRNVKVPLKHYYEIERLNLLYRYAEALARDYTLFTNDNANSDKDYENYNQK